MLKNKSNGTRCTVAIKDLTGKVEFLSNFDHCDCAKFVDFH